MAILIDADVIIEGERGRFDVLNWLASRGDEDFEIAAFTVAELWHGVERATGAQKHKRQHYLETILEILPVIDYTEEIALLHAQLWAQLETAGKMIGDYDLIVAATALHYGRAVATFNRRHFECIPRLKVIEPEKI